MILDIMQTALLIVIAVYLLIDAIAAGRRHSRVLNVMRSEAEGIRREIAAKIPSNKRSGTPLGIEGGGGANPPDNAA